MRELQVYYLVICKLNGDLKEHKIRQLEEKMHCIGRYNDYLRY